jgi:ubiquinone/menaquinone biosynthesis C-methylase UbiE
MRAALGTAQLREIYGRIALRYDFQHGLITARSDQRGRRLLVAKTVREGDRVLDCGAGTGTTGLLAAEKTGRNGRVTLFDLSGDMLAVARAKAARSGLSDEVDFLIGDMARLPFGDGRFDAVLSTYSMCPLYDPEKGATELYRATRPGGKIGVAHSTEPENPVMRWLADRVEDFAWRFPWLSMGCRSVSVLPALERAGGRVLFVRRIGIPLWPFLVFVVEKPENPE